MRHKLIRELFPDLKPKAPSISEDNDNAMMLAVDDPLRNTPEKARAYAVFVSSLAEAQWAKATKGDVDAAMRLIGA